jgi:hypothetical protein
VTTAIRLNCHTDDQDSVVFSRSIAGDLVLVKVRERDNEAHIHLSLENQRALFNWLGVQLHTVR